MHRALSYDNKLCYQRDIIRRHRIHQKKLQEMKPTSKTNCKHRLDNGTPSHHNHLRKNLKKKQMDQEVNLKIQHENKILMDKMCAIMRSDGNSANIEFNPGLRLNGNQGPVVDCYLSNSSLYTGNAVDKGSMNFEFRKRESERIMRENYQILKRIKERKPVYNKRVWEKV